MKLDSSLHRTDRHCSGVHVKWSGHHCLRTILCVGLTGNSHSRPIGSNARLCQTPVSGAHAASGSGSKVPRNRQFGNGFKPVPLTSDNKLAVGSWRPLSRSPGSISTSRAFACAPSSPPTTDGCVGDVHLSPNFTSAFPHPHHPNGHAFQKLAVSHSVSKIRKAARTFRACLHLRGLQLMRPLQGRSHQFRRIDSGNKCSNEPLQGNVCWCIFLSLSIHVDDPRPR